ncbi:MAG: GTPase [Desulfurococcaceae archaeon]
MPGRAHLPRRVASYRELYSAVVGSLKTLRGRPLDAKLRAVYEVVDGGLLQALAAARAIEGSGEFYRELYRTMAGEDVGRLSRKIAVLRRVAREVYGAALSRLSQRPLDRSAYEEAVGRLLSMYRRLDRRISKLNEFLLEVSRMPDVSGDYVILIAGMPQVGKSTLLSRLTRAKPEIGSYPFTTKTLIAGHLALEPYRIVLVDSPGLLDSPIESKGEVERRAVLAIKYLADHVLYVFDPRPEFYYSLDAQIAVYREVVEVLGGRPVTVVVNKVDAVDGEAIKGVLARLREELGEEPLPVSALLGTNLDSLARGLVEAAEKAVAKGKRSH